MNRRLLSYLAALCFPAVLTSVEAHELRPGYLEVNEITPTNYEVVWKAPILMGRPLAVEAVFPDDCETSGRSNRSNKAGSLISSRMLSCETPLQGHRIDLKGLDATLTDVLVRVKTADGVLQALRATPDAPMVELSASVSTPGVAKTYFLLGVEHILFGIDHLLFVLALILLISGVRRLVETITAFTVAHSITLMIASLGWLSLPSAPVEAVIALSIVFLANEIASKRSGTIRLSERQPWLVAFIFGLLHGFGFAGALAEIGLPEGDVPAALLTFNLGVEAGQLAFLAAVLVLLAGIARLQLRPQFDGSASYAIGITASVWLLQRIV